MEKAIYFTPEMGARLRELREKKGLTQEEVAVAMGLTFEARASLIGSIEHGRKSNPSVSTLTRYLRAVGASWHDLADLFDKTKLPAITREEAKRVEQIVNVPSPVPAARTGLPVMTPAEKVIAETQEQTVRYQEAVNEMRVNTPLSSEGRQEAVKRYQSSNLEANVIKRMVKDCLKTEASVTVVGLMCLQVYARKVHGALRHSAKIKDPAKREAKRAREMSEALDVLQGTGLDPVIVEKVRAVVCETFESWLKN
jgi:transcriptional regulator with XRE-family HTH domain